MDQPLAKVVGELLKRPVDTACNLIESLLGEPFKVGGAALADQVAFWQWQNRVRIVEKFRAIQESKGIRLRVIPPEFLLPFIRDCGDTADDVLQDAWAQLLAAALENDLNEHPGFVHALKEFSPNDAKILRAIVEICPGITEEKKFDWNKRVSELSSHLNIPSAAVRLSLNNLYRLGMFNVTGAKLSGFARSLLRACLVSSEQLESYIQTEASLEKSVLFA